MGPAVGLGDHRRLLCTAAVRRGGAAVGEHAAFARRYVAGRPAAETLHYRFRRELRDDGVLIRPREWEQSYRRDGH